MELKLVSFELAKKLKEACFDEWCIDGFALDCIWNYNKGDEFCFGIHEQDLIYQSDIDKIAYRPTLELAKMWFREKHDIHIWAIPVTDENENRTYMHELESFNREYFNDVEIYRSYDHATYEAAIEAGLLKACELITKN